jgi:hypothetical protein
MPSLLHLEMLRRSPRRRVCSKRPAVGEFDLSALTHPQFLAFFFDRPIVGDKDSWDLFRSGIDRFVASNPTTVVAHLQAMCRNFSELTKVIRMSNSVDAKQILEAMYQTLLKILALEHPACQWSLCMD